MKTISKFIPFLTMGCLAVWTAGSQVAGQSAAQLAIQTYAGVSITGTVGAVYSIDYIADLGQTNNPSAWRCLEFLQLPASPYLWVDKSGPVSSHRFYRALPFAAPTNTVFIPPGTFRMGSPPNEVTDTVGLKNGPRRR